jgi:hypothetical protein
LRAASGREADAAFPPDPLLLRFIAVHVDYMTDGSVI